MAAGEIYEITLDTSLNSQDISNVFFYRELSTFPSGLTNVSEALASSFFLRTLPDIRAFMTDDVTFERIRCRSLFRDGDKHEILLTGRGDVTNAETMPPFVAMAIRLAGNNPAVRNGWKRFAGITEGWNVDGILSITGGAVALLNALLDELNDNLRDTGTGLIQWAEPVLVKRVRSGSPGNYTYRLPQNASEAVVSVITSVTADLVLSSQTSRKISG